jgi:DNA helicase-2/ATP-dependent DNA helicase PcrA
MDVSRLLDPLNAAQREAVSAKPGHYLVLAGAGSGKTRVLVHRIAWLTEVLGESPYGVLAVTFTNKAAGEMRNRSDALMPHGNRGLTVGTFHGIAHRLLRQHWRDAKLPESFQILDADDQQRLVKKVIVGMGLDEARFPARRASWFINHAKDEGKRPEALDPGYHPEASTLREIYVQYEAACRRAGLVDFAELLLRAHEMLLGEPALLEHYRNRYRNLLVDEFQDTNTLQYAWLRVLAGESGRVFAVGDDDQAIYGWRGAKVENVQGFLRDFPGAVTIRLEQNYRSTGTILDAANAIIACNFARLGKALWTEARRGDPIELYAAHNAEDEARFVVARIRAHIEQGGKPSECAVLYRSNAQSRLFEELLLAGDIPYRVYGGLRFFERAEIKDTLAWLRLVTAPHDDAAFERALGAPPRGVGERSLEQLRQRARASASSLFEAALDELGAGGFTPKVRAGLSGFIQLIQALQRELDGLELHEQFAHVIARTNLRPYFEKEAAQLAESRLENLDELINAASRFERTPEDLEAGLTPLTAFLAHAALEAGEGEGEAWQDCVQLMTLHSAKGLEFPRVFLVGLEEGLFPSQKSIGEPGRLEEERRLAYVGITRAQQHLTLSYAESRRMHGMESLNRPSRFLGELPTELLREVRPRIALSRPFGRDLAQQAARARWGDDDVIAASPRLRLGQRVSHARFGEGIVIGAEGDGSHARIQVNFEREGAKWLVLAYANLTPL